MKKDFIPFIAHSDLTKEIYIQYSRTKKIAVTDQVIIAMELTGRMGQKTGKWIEPIPRGDVVSYGRAYWECDQCHKAVCFGNEMNFCPNCGSYNGGDSHEGSD